jgi:hypothetical protein
MLPLWFGKVQSKNQNERDKKCRWVYHSLQQGATSWFGTGLGFPPSLPEVAPSFKSG